MNSSFKTSLETVSKNDTNSMCHFVLRIFIFTFSLLLKHRSYIVLKAMKDQKNTKEMETRKLERMISAFFLKTEKPTKCNRSDESDR